MGARRDYIWGMPKLDEKDTVERLGPPDKIVNIREPMRSRAWQCSRCGLTVENDKPIRVPAPCPLCGSIAFEMVKLPPH